MTAAQKNRHLILWGAGTTRTMRPHWVLHELGLDYEMHPTPDVARGVPARRRYQLRPQMTRVNPFVRSVCWVACCEPFSI